MTPREKIQLAYELAFFPPRLNELWHDWRDGRIPLAQDAFCEALDDACRLSLALPESGYGAQRALERLAVYQARSRAYGLPRFVRAARSRLGLPDLNETTVPGWLVRDIALPAFARRRSPEDARGQGGGHRS